MNSNPFSMRLQEMSPPKEVVPPNPFEQRKQKKEEAGESLWNGFYDLLFSKDETPFEQGIGQVLRGMGTSILGTPGNIIQTSKAIGEALPEAPSIFQREPNFVQEYGSKALSKVPTTEDLISKFDQLTENQYQPGSNAEQLVQDIAGDIGTLLLPVKTVGQAGKAIAGGILGNLASEGMKELEYGEGSQAAAKIGTIMLVSLINPGGANKYVQSLYNQAEASLPENAFVASKNFTMKLDGLKKELQKGLTDVESKKPVLGAIKDVSRNAKDGKVSIRDLMEAKRNLNEQRAAKIYDPEFKGGKKARTNLKKNYGKLAEILDDSIEEYGKTNKDFFNPYKEANQAWGGIEQSKNAGYTIKKILKNYKLFSSLGAIAGLFSKPLASTGAIGAGYTALKSYEMMHRIMMNPQLRKYYIGMIKEASKNNAAGVIKNAQNLNKDLKD